MRNVIIAATVVLGLSVVSHAADSNKYEVGIMPGYAIPVVGSDWTDSDTGFKSSFGINAYGDYKLNDKYSAGLDLGYNFGHDNQATSDYSIKMLNVGVHGKMFKDMDIGSRKGKLYGVAGFGVYHWSYDSFASVSSDSGSKFGINLGLGYDMEIAAQLTAGLELRYHHIFNMVKNASGDEKPAGNLVPMLKVGYSF